MMYPFILVEVPHQRPAEAYAVFSEAQFVEACESNAGSAWAWPDTPSDDDYLAAFAHDLHHYERIESEEEARLRMTPRDVHQDARIRRLIREAAQALGWTVPPSYCTQNAGDCASCSLRNYGRDCMNNAVL